MKASMSDWTERLKWLYGKFIKYPRGVRIAVAVGVAVVIVTLLLVPGETALTAVIAFGATFSGVFVSFWVERRRKEAEEKGNFAQTLRGLLIESAGNHTMAGSLKKWTKEGKAQTGEVLTDTIQAALRDPLFYRWANHSLVATAQVVRIQSTQVNNVLSMHRQAATFGHGMTPVSVKDLQIRAETIQEVLGVFQGLLERTMFEFGTAVVADERTQEIDKRLAEIMGRGADRMEEAAKVDTGTDSNAKEGAG